MHDMLAQPHEEAAADGGAAVRLSTLNGGARGVIVDVRAEDQATDRGVDQAELERRLLEFGFVEGAVFEVLHEGLIGGDPIAVKLDDMRVALRRRDAADVWVRLESK
ncbi:MAG: FeoA family protein [Pseudomonadota bacterium]